MKFKKNDLVKLNKSFTFVNDCKAGEIYKIYSIDELTNTFSLIEHLKSPFNIYEARDFDLVYRSNYWLESARSFMKSWLIDYKENKNV